MRPSPSQPATPQPTDDAGHTALSASSGSSSAVARRRSTGPADIAMIGVFAALIVVGSVVPPLYLGFSPVPVTLQTLIITLTALLLGACRGFAAVGLFLVVGLVGLPVFAGFHGGLAVLAGPTAGYLIGFAVLALGAGALAQLGVRRPGGARIAWFIAAGVVGILADHVFGILGLMLNAKLSLGAATAADVIFLPGDAVKAALAIIIALPVHRAFPTLLGRRVRR